MKCVIVAAGTSSRLRPRTDTLPKCLLPVGGKTILGRTVENLLQANINNIALVVGFEAAKIRSFLDHDFPGIVFRFIHNPDFAATNNAYSLNLSREFALGKDPGTRSDEGLLVMDSDIVFHPELLRMFVADEGENKIAVRVNGDHDDEEVRVGVDTSQKILRIGKGIDSVSSYGESIGIEMFSARGAEILFTVLSGRVGKDFGKGEFYELAFQEMIDSGTRFKAIDVGNIPVIEIDSELDFEIAEKTIAPLIDSSSNVRIH